MTAVLRGESLSVSYGGVRALTDVSIEVRSGQLVGLIGPNGAGKTTFIDAITGFTPSRGVVTLEGMDISALPPHARARAGLARTWQSTELFQDLSVGENLAVAAASHSPLRLVREVLTGRHPERPSVVAALGAVGMSEFAESEPASLSAGQRKLVGVARALASNPTVVCLDEPAAGLDTAESFRLGQALRKLASEQSPLLLIDHDMALVLGICDHIYVLNFGVLIAEGSPDSIRRDPAVIEAYLGAAANPPERESLPLSGSQL